MNKSYDACCLNELFVQFLQNSEHPIDTLTHYYRGKMKEIYFQGRKHPCQL
jgi:hypothetical protein